MKARVIGFTLALVLGAATDAQSAAHQSFHVALPQATASKLVAARFAGQNVALSDFVLKFTEPGSSKTPDHLLKALGVMPVERDLVRFTLHDRHGADAFAAEARFIALGSGVIMGSGHREGCDESCELPIQPPAPDQTLVLAGFELGRPSGDSKLRKIAISALPERGVLRVTFSDGLHTKYDARVRYALIPKSLVSGYYTVRGEFGKGRSTIDRHPGTPVLQGFSAELKAGARPLHRISIVSSKAKFELGFRDASGLEPYRASVDYVILNQP